MRRRVTIALVIALAFAFGAISLGHGGGSAVAQGAPTVSSSVSNRFPDGLRFSVEATSSQQITEVALRYKVLPDGVAIRAVARCTPDTGLRVSCSVEIASPTPYIPSFSDILYSWRIVDGDGRVTETDERLVVYADTRFDWKETKSGNLTVHTYGNVDGRPLAAAGRVSLDKTGLLLSAPVDFPVRVVVYNSVSDMSPAMQRRSDTFSQQIVTLGQRVSTDTVFVLNDRGAVETLQHELAHIVTKEAGEGGLGSLPAWLDEGTAVNAQNTVGAGYEAAFRGGVSVDGLLSWRSMSSPPGNPANVNLFYGEAYRAMRYLIDTYGEDKYAKLFAVFKRGARVDDALIEVYGKDQITLENEWRQSLKLPPRPTGDGSRSGPKIEGTLTPLGTGGIATPTRGDATPTPGDDAVEVGAEGDDGGSAGLVIAIAAAAIVIAVGVGGIVVARRR